MWIVLFKVKLLLFWVYCYNLCFRLRIIWIYFSLNSSQNSFYISKYWKNHSKISSFSLILGTKNLAEYWDQTVLNKTSTRRPLWRLVDWKGDSISSPPLSCVGLKAGSRDPDKETAVHLPHYPAEVWKQVAETQTRRQHFISPIILRWSESR